MRELQHTILFFMREREMQHAFIILMSEMHAACSHYPYERAASSLNSQSGLDYLLVLHVCTQHLTFYKCLQCQILHFWNWITVFLLFSLGLGLFVVCLFLRHGLSSIGWPPTPGSPASASLVLGLQSQLVFSCTLTPGNFCGFHMYSNRHIQVLLYLYYKHVIGTNF